MYRKIDERRAVSESGSEVLVRIGRRLIEYKENDNLYEINIECLEDPFRITVYSNSVEKWDPPRIISISSSESKRIINNVIEALDVIGGPYEVV